MDQFLSSDACGQVEYGFVNYHENTVHIYWIDTRTGEAVPNQELGYGERGTSFITTFVGHKFRVHDTEPNEDPLENEMMLEFTVQNHGIVGIKNHVQPVVPPEGIPNEVRSTSLSAWIAYRDRKSVV